MAVWDNFDSEEFKNELGSSQSMLESEGTSLTSMGGAMVNELVKSYGFRRDSASGEWSWSLGNIGEAFKEDPFWTTLDYASLLFAPAKYGLALRSVSKGVGAVGKGYKALKAGETVAELGGKSATSKLGRIFQAFGGDRELAAATDMFLSGPSRLHGFRLPGAGNRIFSIANPITTQVSDDYVKLVDRFGAEVWETKAIAKSAEREKLIGEAMFARRAENISRQWDAAGLTDVQRKAAARALDLKMDEKRMLRFTERMFGDNTQASEAYKATWAFRNTIHEESYRLGLISEETYKANLHKWNPRIYEEWEKVRREMGVLDPTEKAVPGVWKGTAADQAADSQAVTKLVSDGAASFQARTDKNLDHLTRILDPAVSLSRMAQAGQTIAKQRYAQALAGSVIAAEPQQMVDRVLEIMGGFAKGGEAREAAKKLAAVHGLSPEKADTAVRLVKSMSDANRSAVGERLADLLGWRKIDSLYKAGELPEYVKNLPQALKDKWLDPAAAEELLGTFKAADRPGAFKQFYSGMLRTFMASKTAYNPATHIRNLFGAAIFSHMATGDFRSAIPTRGWAALKKGADPQLLKEAAEAGILSSSFDRELYQHFSKDVNLAAKSALDWLPDGKVGSFVKGQANKAERLYRFTDEVYKLDAWIRNVEKGVKKYGVANRERALNEATLAVNKFMPNFLQHSAAADLLRKGVPFAGFTSEAMRVWKNVLDEKPHLALFYNHMAESMSQTFGAIAGMSPDDIEQAQKSLPSYLQGKKTLMLPFKIGNEPQFLDLSYLIPMGSIQQAQDQERFFLTGIVDPTTNPIVNMGAAVATGRDPFTGNELEPSFTERQLGVAVEGPRMRKALGLGEHMLKMFLPPWAPPGYAGVNMLEAARGQIDPRTGAPLEDGVVRTVFSNLSGFRTTAPDVAAQIRNAQEEVRRIGELTSQAWKRWEFARANGSVTGMEEEKHRIVALKTQEGHEDPLGFFADGVISRKQLFNNLSTGQLETILGRAEKLGKLSPEDERIRAELVARYQSRKPKRKKPLNAKRRRAREEALEE